ncbi:hypothetical protein OCT63_13915 [Vibrio sp. RW]|uniref:hypothetical protein n=1 Tax=Vibrio sp. RW TaxID=2998833 RepID=UPI0022CD68E1|nr:hypothetical protein [Vibrio sp. RW]MDA0145316.1 hypothetical protein [Vibrio sp. RW]
MLDLSKGVLGHTVKGQGDQPLAKGEVRPTTIDPDAVFGSAPSYGGWLKRARERMEQSQKVPNQDFEI